MLLISLSVAVSMGFVMHRLVSNYNAQVVATLVAEGADVDIHYEKLSPSWAAAGTTVCAIIGGPLNFCRMYGWRGLPYSAVFLLGAGIVNVVLSTAMFVVFG